MIKIVKRVGQSIDFEFGEWLFFVNDE